MYFMVDERTQIRTSVVLHRSGLSVHYGDIRFERTRILTGGYHYQ